MAHDTDSTMTESQSSARSTRHERSGASTDGECDPARETAARATVDPMDSGPTVDAATDRCETCGTTIEPNEYRLSRIVDDGATTVAAHYCSEACFPDEPVGSRSESTDRATEPQDWSYCR